MVEKKYYKPEIETMSREDFLKYQWKLLKNQIEYVYANSGLCQRLFKKAKITPDDINSVEDFRKKVPFTNKPDLLADQQERPPYGTRLCVREDEIFITWLTSGTSGKGQEVHTLTEDDWDTFLDIPAMMYVWSGWKRGEKVMNPLPVGITAAAPFHYLGLQRVGCDVFNLGAYDTKTKLEHMKRFKITGIFSTPAYLEALMADAEDMGLDPAKDLYVRKIMTAIQAYPVSFVHKVEEKWNAKLYDYYGSTQYAFGSTCEKGAAIGEQRGYYHLYDWIAFHEIINPETGQWVEPGEVGEMVVTPLIKRASPYLRFRMADRVRYFPHNACDCGRPFALAEAGTIGRYDDMMKIKGVNIWPETIDEVIFTKNEAVDYRGKLYITDDGREKADIVIEFHRTVTPEVKKQLTARIVEEIHDKTGINFNVLETKEPIPQVAFKIRRWTDERAKGLEKKA
ncbi:MAG: AMP-binding protein [Chloroflexi bacterium]|nr:AMP-binding protein [Chloroflexota bacterium]